MGKYALDLEKYASIARQAAAESCVLLKNEDRHPATNCSLMDIILLM